MYALTGYIDKNRIVTNESIDFYEGCSVIITILDSETDNTVITQSENLKDDAVTAARELSGMWAAQNDISVDETVRNMRKVRHFDF